MLAISSIARLHSNEYEELMQFCRSIQSPYTIHDVQAFNAIYRCICRKLSQDEKRRAERLVDLMIEGLEVPPIYGVV